jgi:hypothetical protein
MKAKPTERPPREHLSEADEALRRAIAMPAEKARPLPTEPAALRREMKARGW